MKLKYYQEGTLSTLSRFFHEAQINGPKLAYDTIVREPEQKARLGRYASEYRALDAVPQAPYVCLRLPTGGGKTLLAAYAVGVARDTWIEKDYPLVLWLVPTNTIRLQTVDALKNTRHAYRQALDEKFEGRVRIFDIGDFAMIWPQDLRDQPVLWWAPSRHFVCRTLKAARFMPTMKIWSCISEPASECAGSREGRGWP